MRRKMVEERNRSAWIVILKEARLNCRHHMPMKKKKKKKKTTKKVKEEEEKKKLLEGALADK